MHPIEMNHCNIKNEPFNHALTYHDNLKNFCHVLRPRNHVIDEYYVNFCDPRGNGVTFLGRFQWCMDVLRLLEVHVL
jgi:hypothetical protein